MSERLHFFLLKKPVRKFRKPITGDLIITPPRLAKPYILRKKVVKKVISVS